MDPVKEFMSIYVRCWNERLGSELERLFKDGPKYFQDVPQSKKALALTMIFDDTKGLLTFLMTEVDKPEIAKDFQIAFNPAFHFIQFLLTEYQDVCDSYVIRIKKCCVFIATLKTATYLHKVACMTLIMIIENFSHKELQLDDVIRGWMTKIRFFTEKELNPILRVLSVVSRHKPDTAIIIENASLIQSCAIKLFDKLFHDIQRNKPRVLEMTIESLIDFSYYFPLKKNDPELLKFYSKIKEVIVVCEKDKRKHDILKAIIKFITNQMTTLKALILRDHEFWLRFFLRCHKEEEYGDIPVTALTVYYEVMGKAISENVKENERVLVSLKVMFLRNLADEFQSQKDLRLSVNGYTNLAESLKKAYSDAAVEEMYSLIASRIIPLYFSENDASAYYEDISDYQESLSRILLYMSNVSNDQITTLVKLCILLIKRYPELTPVSQSTALNSLKRTLSNIEQLQIHVFREFIKNIIFEGIIWSCSHSLFIDTELQRELESLDKRPICYKNYVPLWKGLLVHTIEYRKLSTPSKIFNEVITTCIKLLQTLNLTIKVREDNIFSDLALSKVAENEADFRIFLNMVDLYDEILIDIPLMYLKDKFSIFLYETIKASYKYPLLSGFYRLVDRSLNVQDLFDTENEVDSELFKMILQYLQNTLHSVSQFPHELQISCVQLILHTPMIFVRHLIDHMVPIFKIALTIGLNDYDVADSALSALEKYSSSIEHDKMNVFIKELMPAMELYLRSKESFQIYEDSFNSKVKSIKNIEDGLENLQKRILLLFGKFELSLVLEFLHKQSLNTGATWDKKDFLEYCLTFPDISFNIQLDLILPRVLELALNCSDRRTRVAAAEVLHSIVTILIAKTDDLFSKNPDLFAPLYKTLFPVLLKLGSDSDEVIRQLYNPLTLQITHWLSSKLMLYSPVVSYLVDSLFDGLSDENNSSLRDFSGICLAEFTKWSIKQSSHTDLAKSPININAIVENITNFARHPSNHRRIAAAIAFNYLHKILAASEEIVNIFWFELLYGFVKGMNGCDDINIQISLDHIQKILLKSKMFNVTSSRRKIPIEFKGGTLKEAVNWLLTQCSSLDNNVRKTAMRIIESLAINIDHYNSARDVISNYIDSNGIEGLNRIVLKDTDDTTRRIVINSDKSVYYLRNLLKTFSCYVWLLENQLIDTKYLFSDLNRNKGVIFTCIKNFTFAATNLEKDPGIIDIKNVTLVCTLRCEVILGLYDLLVAILSIEISDKNWVYDQVFHENLFALISLCIIEPQKAGFDVKNLLITESLPLYLEKIINMLMQKLPLSTIHLIESRLNSDINNSAEEMFYFEDNFSDNYTKNLNIVKGLILLNKCGLFHKLNAGRKIVSDAPAKILKIFNSLKVSGTDIFVELSSEKKLYLEYLLKLLLNYEINPAKAIIDKLLIDVKPWSFAESKNIPHGEHFFNTFKDVIISSLLNDINGALREISSLLQHFPDVALFLSEGIVVWVLKHKSEYPEIAENLANEFIERFNQFDRVLNNLEGRKKAFTNIYRTVVRLKRDPLSILHNRGLMYTWILKEFMSTDDLAKKTRVLNDFLICLTGEDFNSPEIRVILAGLKQSRTRDACEELQGNTLRISKISECFQALLTLLPITKSTDVFYATINFAMGIGKSAFNDATYGHLTQYINNISGAKALESLDIAYKLFMDTSVVNERLDVIRHFVLPVIENCSSLIIDQFFEENIKEIFAIISQDLPRNIMDCKKMIVSKIGCYNLIEFMFNRIEIEKINENDGFIAKHILQGTSGSVSQRIFKCTLQVRILKTEVLEHEEILRLLHCAAYNCCITIASTSKDEKYFLSLFAENRKTGQLIWEHIIDCKKTCELSQTFKEYPKQKKKLLNIKNTLKNRRNTDSMIYSYVKSYNLASSTLNENIYAHDFNEIKFVSPSSNESMAITLEIDDINNHECMYSLCGILKMMAENEICVGDGRTPPRGLQCFAGSIGCVQYNAQIFMLKVILNNQTVFKPYAELFLAPTMIVLLSMLKEGKLNYIITDALLMLVDWGEVAVPDEKTSHHANELFALLVQKLDADALTEYVVRYNFRIVELLVQVWHHCLEIPPGLNERIHNTKQMRFRAVQLILIYLANQMAMKLIAQPDILEFLIEFLKENWDYKEDYVLYPCEAISLFLKFSNSDDVIHDSCAEKIRHVLRQLQMKNADRLVKCIHAMCKAYPALSDCFFEFIIANCLKVGPPNIAKCIEVFGLRIPRMSTHDILRDLNYIKLQDLLNNKVISCEKACLEVINQLVPLLDPSKFLSLATLASAYARHDSADYRKLIYEIFMNVYKKYSKDIADNYQCQLLVDMSKKVLLPGLLDPFEELQVKLTKFWTEEIGLRETCIDRVFDILDVYSPDAEKDFLPIFAIIFLHLTNKSPIYENMLFPGKSLGLSCDYKNYQIAISWRMKNLSYRIPLFTSSYASQYTQRFSLSSFTDDEMSNARLMLRATFDDLDTTTTSFSLGQLSTLKDTDVFIMPEAPSRNILSKRFLKSSSDSSKALNWKLQHYQWKEDTYRQELSRQKNSVKLNRAYRIGDFPDIDITHESLLSPLKELLKKDQLICKDLVVSMISSLLSKVQSKSKNGKRDNGDNVLRILEKKLNYILENRRGNGLIIAAVLELMFKMEDIRFNPTVVTHVSQSAGFNSIGALLLERILLADDTNYAPPSKKSRTEAGTLSDSSSSAGINQWIYLAELYESINEVDIVLSIFQNHVTEIEELREASVARSNGMWNRAYKYYGRTYNSNVETIKRHSRQGMFECLARLCNWNAIVNNIQQELNSKKSLEYILETSESVENGWMSLWYFQALIYKVLTWRDANLDATDDEKEQNRRQKTMLEEFMHDLMIYLKIPSKAQMLKDLFSEEIAGICSYENKELSRDFINSALDKVREQWSHLSPLSSALRAREVIKLRGISNVEVYRQVVDEPSKAESILVKYWLTSVPHPRDDLLPWDKHIVYRSHFFDDYKKLSESQGSQMEDADLTTPIIKLKLQMIESAFQQENKSLMKCYLESAFYHITEDDNELHNQYRLNRVRFRLLRARVGNNTIKLNQYPASWKEAEEILRNDNIDINTRISTRHFICDLSSTIIDLNTKEPELFREIFQSIEQYILPFMQDTDEEIEGLNACYLNNLKTCCIDALRNTVDTEIIIECYERLLKYCHDKILVNEAPRDLLKEFVRSTLKAMSYGSRVAANYFPCLLNREYLEDAETKEIFNNECKKVPVWRFLKWQNQLLPHLPTDLQDVVVPIVERLIQKYPHALVYSFRLTLDTHPHFKNHPIIAKYSSSFLQRHELNNFIEAMQYLVRPELYFLYYLRKLLEATKDDDNSNLIEHLLKKVYPTRKLQGSLYKYIAKYREEIVKMKNMSKEEIEAHVKQLIKELKISLESNKDSQYLKDYSPWLAEFNGSHIEIPGQYTGDQEPWTKYHVRIMKMESQVQVMKSAKKPIKLSIIGNDAKNYHFLMKFGEDLRLDERIEQAFGIMNNILQSDISSSRRNLTINTYQVTSLAGSFGLIAWIDNTKNLNDYINFNLTENAKNRHMDICKEYINWIAAAKPAGPLPIQYKEALLKYNQEAVTNKMNHLMSRIDWDLLRRTFLMLSPSLESFMSSRRNFVITYGTMCIGNWILGVGDRHLENTLISVDSGKVTAIDFASAFGGGIDLPIPELMPFRLTNQIKGLMKPFDENDEFKAVMVHVLRALRSDKGPLLAYLRVVASENLNWIEHAQQLSLKIQEKDRNLNWLASNKFEYVSLKLSGKKPSEAMLQELKDQHFDGKYFPRYTEIVSGIEGNESLRAKKNDDDLSAEEQVTCLLDQATDLNILGRTYFGWCPWV